MKAFLTLILCFFSGTTLFAQKNTTGQLKLMEARCDSLIKHDRFDALKVQARQALRITPDNDWYHQALFSFYIGRSYELPINYDSAIYYLERSQAFARKAKDAALLSRPLRGLVFAYYSSGEEVKKDKVAKELEIIADTTSNELLRVNNNATLANHYASKGIHEKQLVCLLEDLTYYKKQLKKGKDIEDSKSNISIDLIKLAELYTTSLGQPEKSIAYLVEARPYIAAENRGSIIFYYRLSTDAWLASGEKDRAMLYYDSLTQVCARDSGMACNVLFSLDLHLADQSLRHSDNSKASYFIQKANALAPGYGRDPYSIAQLNYLEGKLRMADKGYVAALPFLTKAAEHAPGAGTELNASIHGDLAACYAGLGQWQKAYEHAGKSMQIQDSANMEKVKQSLANAEAKYQNKEKQQQIEAKDIQLLYGKKERLWLMAGLVLMAAVAVLLIAFYRNKKKTADILDHNNKKLAQLNNELEEANQTKAKLFGIISHDLRSPISQVYQFLKLQQLDPDLLSEEQKAALGDKIQKATGSLLETMEDLLLWSKTQMNAFVPDKEETSLNPVLAQSLALLHLNTEAKNITIENNVPAGAKAWADPYFLQTIFRNLLQNAVKAAPANSMVVVNYGQDAGGDRVLIQNGGSSFTQQDYERLLSAKEDGTSLSGLGLRLVHELSEKMGARVMFSAENGVTTAAIIFPQQ